VDECDDGRVLMAVPPCSHTHIQSKHHRTGCSSHQLPDYPGGRDGQRSRLCHALVSTAVGEQFSCLGPVIETINAVLNPCMYL
jgi:hypothetical protein